MIYTFSAVIGAAFLAVDSRQTRAANATSYN